METKIKAAHLKKQAVLYIRQSTMKQVCENTESTLRQYALKERLTALGWPEGRIKVIDSDLGKSGAKADREGFKELVADVGAGEAGAVACIECSRLSRNSGDWGRLMEICALTKTLLIDADGIYDPNCFNDRMLLGLKGTMSEAELHFLGERMAGGRLSKAMRGELRIPIPVGYVYDPGGRTVKDPDERVRHAVQLLFDTFARVGTARGTAVFFRQGGYEFPVKAGPGYGAGDHAWQPLDSSRVVSVLHNPTYAGIYSYGRNYSEHTLDGKRIKKNPESEWTVRLEGHHEGYISEGDYYRNIALLDANSPGTSGSAPREGLALLQGIALCGKCGRNMKVRYSKTAVRHIPYYYCSDSWNTGEKCCQSVPSASLDAAVSNMVLDQLTPLAISAAVEVEREAVRRKAASDDYFLLQIERADYEQNLARKRYMSVDPENRLVAFELERLWNEKIALRAQAEEELARHNREKNDACSNMPSASALGPLDMDVRETWRAGTMRIQDKKRIIRCLVDEVAITRNGDAVTLGVIFKTGATKVMECEGVKQVWEYWATAPATLDYIRQKSAAHTVHEIVDMLNKEGRATGSGLRFSPVKLRDLMRYYEIPSLEAHLREQGYLYTDEKAESMGISPYKLGLLRDKGTVGVGWKKIDGRSMYMYAPS